MQIYNLYAKDYLISCDKIANERNRLIKELNKIKGIKAYPSQANFIMLDLGENSSFDFCVHALENNNLLLKDLSTKNFFYGRNFIRVSVKDTNENNQLLELFKNHFA